MERRARQVKVPSDGHEVRIGRGKAAKAPNELKKLTRICNGTAAILMMARASNRSGRPSGNTMRQTTAQTTKQRVAVRITYTTPKTAGQWKAHGTYLQREAAVGQGIGGFGPTTENIGVPTILNDWQSAGDKRLFKAIISPENAEGLDFQQFIRDTMARVEADTGQKLEWVAVVHRNTDHPHAHIAIRGLTRDGKELQLPKEFIKTGFRENAQDVATNQLGYRTQQQIERTISNEIHQNRVTSLDRLLDRAATVDSTTGVKNIDITSPAFTAAAREPMYSFAMARRLATLETMGLAQRVSGNVWTLPGDYQTTLRTLQIAGDRQKMMSRHMEPASSVDQRILTLNWNEVQHISARVLGHGEDEATGKRFMMLESLDGTIIHLPHRADTEAMRHRGELRRNEVVTIGRDRGRIEFFSHGNAEKLLSDAAMLRLLRVEQSPLPGLPGWLGRFHEALSHHEPQQAQPKAPTRAMRFTEAQAAQLLSERFPGDPAKQAAALVSLKAGDGTVELAEPPIALRFSVKTGGFYAVVTDDDRSQLETKLGMKRKTNPKERTNRERD